MRYDHILIRYGELGLKGKNMKQFLVKLQNNIKAALTAFPNVIVRRTQGRLFVELHGENAELIIEELQKIYGIHSMSLAIKVDNELEAIKQGALTMLRENENINTFKIAFDSAVNASVKEKLRQDTPKTGGASFGGTTPSVAELAQESRIIK